ncbi:MAG: hypothetical protein ABIO02_00435 [Patescibacteria group bacterium]
MKQRELLFLAVGVFLTMIAGVVNTIYHIQNGPAINREIQKVEIPKVNIDSEMFTILQDREQ